VSAARNTCNKYFAEIVKRRGVCERCGAPPPHEAAHIIRRRFVGDPDGISLRTNPDNAWCLCIPCHRTVDGDAEMFMELVERTIGLDLYREFQRVKNSRHRPWREKDWVAERARLLALKKEVAA
jgi:hypothetical protein